MGMELFCAHEILGKKKLTSFRAIRQSFISGKKLCVSVNYKYWLIFHDKIMIVNFKVLKLVLKTLIISLKNLHFLQNMLGKQ